jgi:GNAT superfamily N-acetyltransferase
MTMATTFRLCTYSDSSLLAWLLLDWHALEGQPMSPVTVRRALGKLLQDPHASHVWIIEQNGQAAGYAVLTFSAPGHALQSRAYVSALYLAPEYRGRDLGRRTRQFLLDVGAALHLPVVAFGIEGEARHTGLLSRPSVQSSGARQAPAQGAIA